MALLEAARRAPLRAATVAEPVTSQTPAQAPARASAQAAAQADGPITVNPSVTWGGTFDGTDYPGVLVGTSAPPRPIR